MKPGAHPPLGDRVLAAYFRRNWRGFWRLMSFREKKSLRARSLYGSFFELHPQEYIDAIVLREGYYEAEVIEALRPYLRTEAVFWDVGANIGLHTVTAARLAPQAQIVAFEPSPATFARLAGHVRLNGCAADLQPIALGDRDGSATLYINTGGNAGMSSIMHPETGPGTSVRLARADTLVSAGTVPAPTVMKLDVEGAEEGVLRGFGELLERPSLQAVVFETTAELLADPAQCTATRRLLTAGFRIEALPRTQAAAHRLANFLAYRP
ncbi:MAG TPA: FkbM family methyltransferase [Lacunisphaera sp.]|nr:FkbM family methyltransferase [Lacunisphaera sp.]HQY06006.1 FkbM family methyltransferase [Lacunisphaera sp.]